jgi:hypothetical protein
MNIMFFREKNTISCESRTHDLRLTRQSSLPLSYRITVVSYGIARICIQLAIRVDNSNIFVQCWLLCPFYFLLASIFEYLERFGASHMSYFSKPQISQNLRITIFRMFILIYLKLQGIGRTPVLH